MYAYIHKHMLGWSNGSMNKFAWSVIRPDLSSILVTFMVDRKKTTLLHFCGMCASSSFMQTDRQRHPSQNKQINKVIKAIVFGHHKYIVHNNSFKVIL